MANQSKGEGQGQAKKAQNKAPEKSQAELTQEKAEARKKELKESGGYKDVYVVYVPKDNFASDFHVAHMRKPERSELSAFFAQVDNDPLGAKEDLLRGCWIEGDNIILDDDNVFMGAVTALNNLLEVRNGFLSKS